MWEWLPFILLLCVVLLAFLADPTALAGVIWAWLAGAFGQPVQLGAAILLVAAGGLVLWAFWPETARVDTVPSLVIITVLLTLLPGVLHQLQWALARNQNCLVPLPTPWRLPCRRRPTSSHGSAVACCRLEYRGVAIPESPATL
jgi:hypothetical protein